MSKKVIIVDDDSGIRDSLTVMLEFAGYTVFTYSNGNPFFNGTYIMPDVILLDKQLSGVDGLDVCRYLKTQPESREIPIVMISASPDINHLAEDAGAEAYVEKPFKSAELLHLIEELTKA